MLLRGLPEPTIAALLAFAAAAFMLLVTARLLVSAHDHGEGPIAVINLFVSFPAFMGLKLLAA